MHDAPSVTCPVGRSLWAALITAALWLAGAAVACLWSVQPQTAWWHLALAWSAVAAGACIGGWSWWRAAPGVLAWDGVAWTWTQRGGAAAAGQVRPALDLQHALLVRWHDGEARRWFWLERRRGPGRWDDLRRAVYSRARPEALSAAEPPAAKP